MAIYISASNMPYHDRATRENIINFNVFKPIRKIGLLAINALIIHAFSLQELRTCGWQHDFLITVANVKAIIF